MCLLLCMDQASSYARELRALLLGQRAVLLWSLCGNEKAGNLVCYGAASTRGAANAAFT